MTNSSSNLRLASCGAGRLTVLGKGENALLVRPVKCFPLSEPGRYLSLRDENSKEIAFVEDHRQLDDASAQALNEALAASGFTFEVIGIESITQDFELRVWQVQTESGNRKFQTALDAWPRTLSDGSYLVEDVFGDLYRFPPLNQLNEGSAQMLWSLVG
ncbi:MAG: DUF1854 domain-containing protein [Verrucomicrobiota bacterium]